MVVDIGLRVSPKVEFFGLDEVNDLIGQGRKVVGIEPGEALMEKRGEDQSNVRLAFVGFRVKVHLADE